VEQFFGVRGEAERSHEALAVVGRDLPADARDELPAFVAALGQGQPARRIRNPARWTYMPRE